MFCSCLRSSLLLVGSQRTLAQQEATLNGHLAGHETDSVTVKWRTTPLDAR